MENNKCEFCGKGFTEQNPNAGMSSRDYHFVCFNRAGYLDGEQLKKEQKRIERNRVRRERHAILTDMGMKRVRGALGGVYYE